MDLLYKALTFKPRRVVPPFSWVEHIPFAATLVSEIKPNLIVELGTHTGNSYFTFCQAVQENNLPTLCYAIDTWQGEVHAGHYDETVYNDVNKYNQENYGGFSYLLRTTFDEAAKQFSDNSIDLLHIDGLHTYEAVKNDYETWLPKVKEGGVILFHDICCRHADFGVWKMWEEIQRETKSTHSFLHCHGLGVLIKTGPKYAGSNLGALTMATESTPMNLVYTSTGDAILNKIQICMQRESICQQLAAINQLQDSLAAINQLQGSLVKALNEAETAKQEILTTRDEINRLKKSFSWKITAPLRALMRKFSA